VGVGTDGTFLGGLDGSLVGSSEKLQHALMLRLSMPALTNSMLFFM
jgi:hypothetical protein